MAISSFVKGLFVASEAAVPEKLSLEEIRKRIFETTRNMEIRSREAAAAEAKAQTALQKTFQQGMTAAQRSKLLAENQKWLRTARDSIGFANQLGAVLETLESAETFMELSETIAQSNVAGAGRFDVHALAKELQDIQNSLSPMMAECRRLKELMEVSTGQFDAMLAQNTPAGQDELMALYAKYDAEPDPVKKAAIQAEIQKKSDAMASASPATV